MPENGFDGLLTITFQPFGRRFTVKKGENILEAAQKAGINIRNVCGGKGLCGKCKVIIKKGEIEFKIPKEEKLLSNIELSQGYVLACQTRCLSDCEVLIPAESRVEGQKILSKAEIFKIEPNPYVLKDYLNPQFLRYVNIQRIEDALQLKYLKKVNISINIFQKLKEAFEERDKGLTLTMRRGANLYEVIDVEIGDQSKRSYGIAIDIGTTKIVVYLVNLLSGDIIDEASDYNKQLIYGEDLISRIGYTIDKEDGLISMQKAVMDTINELILRLANKNQIEPHEIIDVCVAGNTVMTYLFTGMDARNLLRVDAIVEKHPIKISAEMLRMNVNPKALVYCLPCASRFIGGDAIGDILLSGMYKSKETSLLIDIGTNVEVVLGSEGWLLSTTAAAGPAFEGWGIRFGTRSIEGAIDHVKINPENFKASYTVIGSTKPKGICGSGLIDVMAEMFRVGILNTFGKIDSSISSQYIRNGANGLEYVIAPSDETSIGQDITISQKDIDILMDSKASACGAISSLLKKMKITVLDVENVYIFGAFGSFLDINNAIAIGLIPEFPKAKFYVLGNGSVAGAYLTLISQDYRRMAEEIAELIAYFDMLKDMDFMDEYQAAFTIPGKRELFPTWWEVSKKLRRT
ncbi:MAG: ASKHA domain-containing protein [Nitrososphaerales archaeon]